MWTQARISLINPRVVASYTSHSNSHLHCISMIIAIHQSSLIFAALCIIFNMWYALRSNRIRPRLTPHPPPPTLIRVLHSLISESPLSFGQSLPSEHPFIAAASHHHNPILRMVWIGIKFWMPSTSSRYSLMDLKRTSVTSCEHKIKFSCLVGTQILRPEACLLPVLIFMLNGRS